MSQTDNAMIAEADLIDRVEVYIRHPVFAGSDEAMTEILEDLERRVDQSEISMAAFHRLRNLILASPHFRDN